MYKDNKLIIGINKGNRGVKENRCLGYLPKTTANEPTTEVVNMTKVLSNHSATAPQAKETAR